MTFLAISGSARRASTTTALLRALQSAATPAHTITVFDRVGELPIFSPDRELPSPPDSVAELANAIADADGLIVASPEYIRAIPGGLKNAIDWLLSCDALIDTPIVLAHASHRGDDMLGQLRLVLGTVSTRFNEAMFLRVPLMKKTPEEIARLLSKDASQTELLDFLTRFAAYCGSAD
ncbi:MAG: NAD(P)H-dependent oxidoreductase [Acidobacteriaceae bacterium]|jgi:NAD(P)H-dependent FMN reductase|nr:NAD(P)H-dependent oxidoreductase [Acidobacteriaceae bacterium]